MSKTNEGKEMVEHKKKELKTIDGKKDDIRYHIHPDMFFNYDEKENTWKMEINLPGIKKENVVLKILEDAFQLKATRDQAVYHLEDYFPFLIKKDSIEANYENGLLIVTGKVKDPLEDAVEIKL